MTEIARSSSAPAGTSRTASTSVFVATLAGVLLATALFLALDLLLARIDRRESDAHAANEYSDGRALLAAGRPREAADLFEAAAAIDRNNVNYGLALGEALLEEGRIADAEATLKPLLDRAENDGAVNLTMAHVMLRENKREEAKAYFHRAIFGRWGADSLTRRTQARFELIDLLARSGSASELLAELLPFEETSPDSTALRRRLGHLFILAGSPARAETIFRAMVRRDARDADAYAGLGEAALALGNLNAARADFAEALRLRPNDADVARKLAVADSARSLDPTQRDIDSRERYVRSRALLERTVSSVGSCAQAAAPSLADSAQSLLSAAPAAHREENVGKTMLAVAIDLWAARSPTCTVAASDTVLRLVHEHLAP